MIMHVTVVGAGVIGLVTALTLEEHGHHVRVVAAGFGEGTTSSIAGAVWFPYRAGPPLLVAVWAGRTRTWLQLLAADHDSGVDLLTGYEITPPGGLADGELPIEAPDGTRVPWWAAAITVERAPAPVTGSPAAWKFAAPRAQPSIFLPYLASKLRQPIERRDVIDLAAEPGDAVINCTGLAARELVRDGRIYPLFGQTVIADPGSTDLTVTITDHRDPDRLFYVIPRRDELVLGGCSLPYPPGAAPAIDPEITARIVDHALMLGIPIGPVRAERVGLRPFRPEVRLERDATNPRIIHNYGHGGAGFTLCRGCAEDVAEILVNEPAT
jgi:D-amino-acid oxidase